jgi:peptide deformylase
MIYPIVAFGDTVLKKKAEEVAEVNEDIIQLVENMYETMYFCKGVGLAAPQIDKSIRVFVIDSSAVNRDDDDPKDKLEKGEKEAFINATMIEEYGDILGYEEGCLSIPGIYGTVDRPSKIKIEYTNIKGERLTREFSGFSARVIQHEYDHIEGVLFTDKLKPIKKQMVKRKLEDIRKGQIHSRYKMKFAK